MSKKLIGIIAIILLLTTTGCTKDETKQEPVKETEVEVEQETSKEEETTKADETEVESKDAESDENTFSLNQTISYDDFDITFTKIEKVKDYEGKSVVKLTYNWTNKSKEAASPFMTFSLKGFQDGVETESFFMSDDIDLGIGQKEVKPGATIENCEAGILVDDESKPLDLELEELIAFNGVTYTMTINPSEL